MSATGTTDRDACCNGKRMFRSFADAAKAASKTAHRRGAKFRPYHCKRCGSFHYGQVDGNKTPRAQVQRRRAQRSYEAEE